MKKKIKNQKDDLPKSLSEIGKDVTSILDIFEYYLIERQRSVEIKNLQDIIRDMRILVGRVLTSHFIKLDLEMEHHFCKDLALVLANKGMTLPIKSKSEEEHRDYLIKEILTSFEWAAEIKRELSHDPVMQGVLIVDIPVLRPFNYSLPHHKLSVVDKEKLSKKKIKK